ncbi:unnamed protein product [Urochloa decumbens]|uniref:Ketoreductase domain-containing protein n=1 Tax=Urochloa decumbens TaxID=240449 RepID=A0ABC8XYR4_9POAL
MAAAAASSTTPLPLDGRVALVTGGSRGIGREVSSHLAALGARVLVNYASNSAKADELVAELASRGLHAVSVRADVSDPDAVSALFDRAEEAFGSPPHIVVACAGILDPKYPALADTTVEDFDATFAVNTRGKFLVCREAARRIPPHSGGRIVAFSSSTVAVLPPGYGEVAAKGITANVVAPGPVRTEMFLAGKDEAFLERVVKNMGRIAETTDIAPVVAFLASEASYWVNGQVIRVNGGVA